MVTRLNLRLSVPDQRTGWINAIVDHWLQAESAEATLRQLSDSAKAAIAHLAHVDELPAPLFWAEYGTIRRAGDDYPVNQTPWLYPQTVSEELYYVGLLHAGRHRGKRRSIHKAETVMIPVDLRSSLIDLRHIKVELSENAIRLLHDLAQFLIYIVEQGEVTLSHGRWLAPRHLQQIGARLFEPRLQPPAPSHKRDDWLRFLSFLAQAGRYVEDGRVTPMGWHWLEQSPQRQLSLLWEGWQGAPQTLRQAYELADAYLPAPWQTLLVRTLRQQAGPVAPVRFAAQLLSQTEFQPYYVANFADLYALESLLGELFAQDLRFLGVVQADTREGDTENRDILQSYALTKAGAWLLHPILHAPPYPPPDTGPMATITPMDEHEREGWQITLSRQTPAYLQAQLATYADYEGQTQSQPAHCYHLHPLSLARAAARGQGLPLLTEVLTALGMTITPAFYDTLARWHDQGRRFQLRPALLLHSRSSKEMAALHNLPDLKDLLGEVLSPTVVQVSASAQNVAAQLAQNGIYVDAKLGADEPLPTPVDNDEIGRQRADGARWLAGRVYTLLAEFMTLPLSPSTLGLDALWQRLSAQEQAVLAAQLDRVEASLRSLLDGYVATPPPTPSDPAQWRPQLEAAIAAEATLTITYFTAGRNLLTRRTLQPYWFEERRGIGYLRAYCHSAERVLLFRLDRIQGIE